jgi:RNA polymerase sigma-70 factor (ECF subfamily)
MAFSEAELRELYVRYAPILHHRARGILGTDEDAADAVQDTFARVLRHHESFRGAASPLTWLYQVNTNGCLNKLRDRKGHARKHQDHREDILGDEAVDADALAEVDVGVVRDLLADSDDETRRVVIHLYFDDMTREQAGAMVGISQPTLRKRLDAFFRRARTRLGVEVRP